jgi:tetratricopeptide (TPR) repeat protein
MGFLHDIFGKKDAEELTRKGLNLVKAGKKDEALIAFDRAISVNPNFADAWAYKGDILYNILYHDYKIDQNYDDALTALNKAIEIDPSHVYALCVKANILKSQKKYDDALSICLKIRGIDPNYPQMLYILPEIYYRLGLYFESMEMAEIWTAVCSKNYSAFADAESDAKFFGRISREELNKIKSAAPSDEQNAEDDTKTVVTVLKTNGSVSILEVPTADAQKMNEAFNHAYKGVSLEKEGKWHEAIIEHKKAIDISSENDPSRAIYYTNLGVCYAQTGNIDEALEQLEIAVRLDPSYERARENLETVRELK